MMSDPQSESNVSKASCLPFRLWTKTRRQIKQSVAFETHEVCHLTAPSALHVFPLFSLFSLSLLSSLSFLHSLPSHYNTIIPQMCNAPAHHGVSGVSDSSALHWAGDSLSLSLLLQDHLFLLSLLRFTALLLFVQALQQL